MPSSDGGERKPHQRLHPAAGNHRRGDRRLLPADQAARETGIDDTEGIHRLVEKKKAQRLKYAAEEGRDPASPSTPAPGSD